MTPLYAPIAVRSYALPVTDDGTPKPRRSRPPATPPAPWQAAWPRLALAVDTETRDDPQRCLLIVWHLFEYDLATNAYLPIEAGFATDERERYDLAERAILDLYQTTHPELTRTTREPFLRDVFYRVLNAGGVAVFFNAPFDISMLADRATPRKKKGATRATQFTFTLLPATDARGRAANERGAPRIRIEPNLGRGNAIQLVGKSAHGIILDLMQLAAVLTGERQSLASACTKFNTPYQKQEHPEFGRITTKLLDYAMSDIRATSSLYGKIMMAYAAHPIPVPPHKVYSSASIGKGYLHAMHVAAPRLTVDASLATSGLSANDILGVATNAYYGARAECRIRLCPVPVVYVDFRSMYPTVCALSGLWHHITADTITAIDATAEVRAVLTHFHPDALFAPATWPTLAAICELAPQNAPMIHRVKLHESVYSAYTLSVGPLTTCEPCWWTLADVLVAYLRSGQMPEIRRAIRFVPGPPAPGLQPVQPPHMPTIDPYDADFFARWVRERANVKRGESPYDRVTADERQALQLFMKIMANATSYGIYLEMNQQDALTARVQGYGMRPFAGDIANYETPGPFCFPPIASFITSGARLLLALAEFEVTARNGCYATMDTDALTIVATPDGGPIAIPGHGRDGQSCPHTASALSWADVDTIRAKFRSLNPYGDDQDVLELEQENYAPCPCGAHHTSAKECSGERAQLWCLAIASKRYGLYNRNHDGSPILRKVSEHGLGAYRNPRDPATGRPVMNWREEFYRFFLAKQDDLPVDDPPWFDQPACHQLTITTPRWLDSFAAWNVTTANDGTTQPKPYHQSVKPFSFCEHAPAQGIVHQPTAKPCLIAPLSARPFDHHLYRDRAHPTRTYQPHRDFVPLTYRSLLSRYFWHPERKFLGPDGQPCGIPTRGILTDYPQLATGFVSVGKEGNDLESRLAQAETEDENLLTYTDDKLALLRRVLHAMPTADLCRQSGASRASVKRWKAGTCWPCNPTPLVLIAAAFARRHLTARSLPIPDPAHCTGYVTDGTPDLLAAWATVCAYAQTLTPATIDGPAASPIPLPPLTSVP